VKARKIRQKYISTRFLRINNKNEMTERAQAGQRKKMLDGKLWEEYLFYFFLSSLLLNHHDFQFFTRKKGQQK
jgi:hypothetical protein